MRVLLMALCASLVAGCEQPSIAPPTIRWGTDACANCSMSIHDEASSCAIVRLDSRGQLESLLCDDLNCAIELLGERGSDGPWTTFVHDRTTLSWIAAADARFVRSTTIKTPMASGIAAYAHTDASESHNFSEITKIVTERSTVRPTN